MKEPGQDHQDRQNRSVSSHMAGRKGISAIPPSVLQTRASNDESAGKNEGKKPNNTGLPDKLKSGIENLSGYSMDDVRVHYNSAKPADLQAHAYAQGTDIHIASGQEKHLPHEAWHVVQQKEGRVKPTRQLKDMVNINDDTGLEKEADVMGNKAIQQVKRDHSEHSPLSLKRVQDFPAVTQGAFIYRFALKRIIEDKKPDSYYKGIKFSAIPTTDGRIIWCDPRNTHDVFNALYKEGVGIMLPGEAEEIRGAGVNIEQDGHRELNKKDQEYYYMGQGLAWTTRIRTCTALAVYDSYTGNSFLCHADGGDGNLGRIIQHLDQYLRMVPDQRFGNTLTTNIFTAEDTKHDGKTSLSLVLKALSTFVLKHNKITRVHPEDTIAVFPGGPAKSLRPTSTLLEDALKKHSDDKDAQTRKYIIDVLRRKPGLATKVYDELRMCYRVLEAEGQNSSFLHRYLHSSDLERYKHRESEDRSGRERKTKSSTTTSSLAFSSSLTPGKSWADYSDEDSE